MFCSLVFAATWISFPAPFGGNINLGDSMLLLGAWMLGGPWGTVACALGATLTDLLGGYTLYAPATLIIKALMVLSVIAATKIFAKIPAIARTILSAAIAETIMVLGYFVYEGFFLYGFAASVLNIPFNLIQGLAAVIIATLLRSLLSHARLPKDLD